MTMPAREFRKYLERDGGQCYSCGATAGLVPQHRVNRGMGGSRDRDVPSNIITFCGQCNGLIEADADAADRARYWGWKLRPWDDPFTEPIYDRPTQTWFYLGDDYKRAVAW